MKPVALILLLFAVAARAPAQRDFGRHWTAAELFASATSSRMILDAANITLERNILVEDDSPGCGYSSKSSAVEILKEGVVLKKTLLLDRLPDRAAYVVALFYPDNPPTPNNGRHLIFSVNGHEIQYELKHFWTRAQVPAGFLKLGENDILVRTIEPDTRFRTWVALEENFRRGSTERLHHPGRSARSSDGGKTFEIGLGVEGKAKGEYSIRLNVEAYQPEGWLESPVVDLAENSNRDVLQLPVEIKDVRLDIEQKSPQGTSLALDIRSGSSLSPDGSGWSAWQPSTGDIRGPDLKGRFLQFRVRCTSSKSGSSPAISGATIHARYNPGQRVDLSEYFAVASRRSPIIRSSFPFEYESPSYVRLREFRSRMKLDSVVGNARTEFEKMLRIKGWAAKQWEWHLLKPEQDIIEWDANRIMTPVAHGRIEGGFCLHYAIVLMQALQSFGFPARVVSVDYSVWGGHEVVEVWSNEFGKWIFLDANFDTYFADRTTGVPLNVLEMHTLFLREYFHGETIDRDSWSREDLAAKARDHGEPSSVIGILGGNANSGKLASYEWWKPPVDLSPYCGGYGPLVMGYLRYMPRANYLSRPTPIPVNHGRTHWGWTGYYCWYDQQTPRSLEHSLFSDRPSDFYWNLNQIDFRATVLKSGHLKIEMASNSPSFSAYELTVNGNVTRQKHSAFEMHLERGANKVEMRVTDSMGNKGPVSELECTYIPKSEQN